MSPEMLLRLPALFIGQDSLHGWNDGYSLYMLICSGYALGYTIGAMRANASQADAQLGSQAIR